MAKTDDERNELGGRDERNGSGAGATAPGRDAEASAGAEGLGAPQLPPDVVGFPDFGHLTLRGLANTRDLGGMPAADGRVVRANRLIRSGALHKATSADIDMMRDQLGIRRVVDLRTPLERSKAPDPEPFMAYARFYHIPVMTEKSVGITRESDLMGDLKLFREYSGTPFETMRRAYARALLEEEGRHAFSSLLEVLLASDEDATLWHCTEGKDRAGLAAVVVEYALGVSWEVIEADYLATNLFVRNWAERMVDALGRANLAKAIDGDIDALFYANPSFLEAGLSAVRERYGSFDGYLAEGLHFGQGKRERLRDKYLVDPGA